MRQWLDRRGSGSLGLGKRGVQHAPNARGKPHRSAKHVGYQQAELVGVGLTNLLGW